MEISLAWLTKKDLSHCKKAFGDYFNSTLVQIHNLGINWCLMEKLIREDVVTHWVCGKQSNMWLSQDAQLSFTVVCNDDIGIDEHECMIQAVLCF